MPVSVERYLQNLPLIAILRQAPWGFATRRVFCTDPNVGATWQDVWEGTGSLTYLAAASALEILSGSAADAAAGTGARTVLVEGLDAAYAEKSETVSLAGVTPVALVNSYLRINSMRVVTAGSGGQPAGDLTLRVAAAGATQALIPAGPNNVSMASHYTVPANRTAYLIGAKYSADTGVTRFMLQTRTPGGLFTTREAFQTDMTPIGPAYFIPVEVTEKTDIKLMARRTVAQTALTFASYDIVTAPKSLSAIRSLGAPTV